MEILLVALIGVAWVHGYVRGRRAVRTYELSGRELRRALRTRG
jgi:hypothetical protein